MGGVSLFFARLFVVFIAICGPIVYAVSEAGGTPKALTPAALAEWTPVSSPGFFTMQASEQLSNMLDQTDPDSQLWVTEEDRASIDQIRDFLAAKDLKSAAGEMLILSSALEKRGIGADEFFPVIMPDLASYVLAYFFAPIILGLMGLIVVLCLMGPWLIRRMGDLIKLVIGLGLGITAMFWFFWYGLVGMTEPALVYAIIEYFGYAASILLAGNLLLVMLFSSHYAKIDRPATAYNPSPVRARPASRNTRPAQRPKWSNSPADEDGDENQDGDGVRLF